MYLEKINALIKAWETDEDAVNLINMALNSFAQYVEVVVNMEAFISTRSILYGDAEAYRQSVMNLDRNRRAIHEAVISNIKILNRFCAQKNLECLYDGDTDNNNHSSRILMGNFAGEVAKEIFDNRKK